MGEKVLYIYRDTIHIGPLYFLSLDSTERLRWCNKCVIEIEQRKRQCPFSTFHGRVSFSRAWVRESVG